jgi:hypothetical protein
MIPIDEVLPHSVHLVCKSRIVVRQVTDAGHVVPGAVLVFAQGIVMYVNGVEL